MTKAICLLMLGLVLRLPAARADNTPADALVDGLASQDANDRAAAINKLKGMLKADPRGSPTAIYRVHLPGILMGREEYAAAADVCLSCINGQPDRVERIEYFLDIRVQALLKLGKNREALSDAKSFYNVATIRSVPKAIDLAGQCLAAANPDDAGIARRFKLQQFAGAATQPSVDDESLLGAPLLKTITVAKGLYTGSGLSGRNRTGQSIGHANVLLLSDHADEALTMFTALTQSASQTTRTEANEGVARALKAQTGTLSAANAWLISVQKTIKPAAVAGG